MKNILDKGAVKLNPELVDNTINYLVQLRREKVKAGFSKKPFKITPKVIKLNRFKHRTVGK